MDVGYWAYVHSKVNVFTQLQYFHKEPDYWLDLQAPYSTERTLEGALSFRLRIRQDKELILRVQRALSDWAPQEEAAAEDEEQPSYWVMSIGLSFL